MEFTKIILLTPVTTLELLVHTAVTQLLLNCSKLAVQDKPALMELARQ
jgi:hypothetical protein